MFLGHFYQVKHILSKVKQFININLSLIHTKKCSIIKFRIKLPEMSSAQIVKEYSHYKSDTFIFNLINTLLERKKHETKHHSFLGDCFSIFDAIYLMFS